MKYLFLDVDGVLNHNDWYETRHKEPLPFPLSCFDPECVRRVNEILEETGARLVISSSWRTDTYLSKTFVKVGLPDDFDVTPSWKHTEFGLEDYDSRGDEIQEFLDRHPYENYVIIDDEDEMLESQQSHFVKTIGNVIMKGDDEVIKKNGGTGLTEILKNRAIDILKKRG